MDIDRTEITIEELCEDSPQLTVPLVLSHGCDFGVYSVPLGEKFEQPCAVVEVWDGILRVLAYPDGEEEPVIIPIGPRKNP